MSPLRSLVSVSFFITQITSLALPLPLPQATSTPTDTIYAYANNNGFDQAANAQTQTRPDPYRFKPDNFTCFPSSTIYAPIKQTYCQDLLNKYLPSILKTSDAVSWTASKTYQWGDSWLGGDPRRCVLTLFPLDKSNTTSPSFPPSVFTEGAGFVIDSCPNGGTAALKRGTGGEKWAFNLTNTLKPGQSPSPADPVGTPIPFKTGGPSTWGVPS